MKKEIAERWVKALRSGEYDQGAGYLCADDKFCCLGVLCELAVADGVIPRPRFARPEEYGGFGHAYLYGESSTQLPPPDVVDWAGLSHPSGKLSGYGLNTLASLNDAGRSFSFIADVIEREWESL